MSIGIRHAQFAGGGEALGGNRLDLLPGVGEEVQVPQVVGVEQDFDLDALDFGRPAVESAGDQHDFGHRTGGREALPVAGRLRLPRPRGRPAGGRSHVQLEFEEVAGTLPRVFGADRCPGAGKPRDRGGEGDVVAFDEAVQVAQNGYLGVLPLDGVEIDCRVEVGEAEIEPAVGTHPNTGGLTGRRRRPEIDVEQTVVMAEGKRRAARVPDAVHFEARIQAERSHGASSGQEVHLEVEGRTPAAVEVDRAADRLKIDHGILSTLLVGGTPRVPFGELVRAPGDRRDDERGPGQQPGAAGEAPHLSFRVVETGMNGYGSRQQTHGQQGEAAPVHQSDSGPDLGRQVRDTADEAAVESHRRQDVDRRPEAQERASGRQADPRQGGDQTVVGDQGHDLDESDVDGEGGQRLEQEVGPHGTPDRRFAEVPAERDPRVSDRLDDDHGDDRNAPDHEQGGEEAPQHEFDVRVGAAVEHVEHAVAAVAGAQVEGEEDDAQTEDHRLEQGRLTEEELGAHCADGRRDAGEQAVDDPEVPVLEQAQDEGHGGEQPEAKQPADRPHLRPGERPDVGQRDHG